MGRGLRGGGGQWYYGGMSVAPVVDLEKYRDDLKAGRYRKAFSSLRAMRRLLEKVVAEAYEGVRPMRDVAAMSVAVKAMAEIFVAEKHLAAAGMDIEEEAGHLLGQDGGMPDLTPRSYVTVTKSYKKGTSARGTPVDEYKITKDGEPGTTVGNLAEEADEMQDEF